MSSDPRFDPTAVEMLRRVGSDRLVGKMAQMFSLNAPARLAVARAALSSMQAEEFSRAMHSLKSSAGQLGARRVQSLCAELEAMPLSEENRDSILRVLDQAEMETKDAVEWLNLGVTPGWEKK